MTAVISALTPSNEKLKVFTFLDELDHSDNLGIFLLKPFLTLITVEFLACMPMECEIYVQKCVVGCIFYYKASLSTSLVKFKRE